jgi:hypothetical protein
MRRDDPVRKTLVRAALLVLAFGFAAGLALSFVPGLPVLVPLAVPAICMMTAANLYALSNRPRGEYTDRALHAFRPLKPKSGSQASRAEPSDSTPTP